MYCDIRNATPPRNIYMYARFLSQPHLRKKRDKGEIVVEEWLPCLNPIS